MRAILTAFAIVLCVFGFSYLMGAFYYGTFDSGLWEKEGKDAVISVTVIIGGTVAIIGFIVAVVEGDI